MKYVVAFAKSGHVCFIDNKLYNHKKQAFNRLRKLSERMTELEVFEIESFNMKPISE
jgi:Tfp pilus assembly ATPase PilU